MEKILNYLNNYFYKIGESGNYKIEDNRITVKGDYLEGQYIRLKGSVMNDGVYKVESFVNNEITIVGAINEVFKGVIYSLAIPKQLIELEAKIKDYELNNKRTNIASESFGAYSYSKTLNSKGEVATWQNVFNSELKAYKQIYDGERRVKLI